MTHRKIFFLSFAATLAVMIPLYLVMSNTALQHSAAAEAKQADIAVAGPTAADSCTVLLSTGEKSDAPERFYLLRLDAFRGRMAVCVLPAEIQVPAENGAVTLLEAVQTAGTAQGAHTLEAALGMAIDHVAFVPRSVLVDAAAHLGLVRIRLCDYIGSDALAALQLDIAGTNTAVLTPQRFAEVLMSGVLPRGEIPTVAAQGAACLLNGGLENFGDVLDVLFTQHRARLSTDIDATEVLRLARTAKLLAKAAPTAESPCLTAEESGSLVLRDDASALLQAAFGGA